MNKLCSRWVWYVQSAEKPRTRDPCQRYLSQNRPVSSLPNQNEIKRKPLHCHWYWTWIHLQLSKVPRSDPIIKIASCENMFLYVPICKNQVKKILSENKTKTNSVLVSNLNKVGQLWHSDVKKFSSPHFKGKLKIENSNFLQFLNLMIKD